MDSEKVAEFAEAYNIFKADKEVKMDSGEVCNGLSMNFDELNVMLDKQPDMRWNAEQASQSWSEERRS